MQKTARIILFISFLFAIFTFPVSADIGSPWDNCVTAEGVATLQCIPTVFNNLVTAALFFSGIIAVFIIVMSGIKFITSGGDPKQVEGAKGTLTYAIIGLVLILLSFFIINIIAGITGAECIKLFGFDNCQ